MATITATLRQAALRRGILIENLTGTSPASDAVRYAAVLELANLGFLVQPDDLKGFSTKALTSTIEGARKVIGADRNMKPIYPGFPKQVEELSTLQLLMEQILHYWTAGRFLPSHPDEVREGLPLEDMLRSARQLRLLSADVALEELLSELVKAPVALSSDDRELLAELTKVVYGEGFHRTLSTADLVRSSTNGENIQVFGEALRDHASKAVHSKDDYFTAVSFGIRNSDHLLRVILSFYGAPAADRWVENYKLAVGTLADRHFRAVRFSSVPRHQRQRIVDALGKLADGYKADRLVARQNLWRRIFKGLHPYDLKLTVESKRALDIVHSNIDYRTLNSVIEQALENRKISEAVELLAEHQPGNLLRRLVAILRLTTKKTDAKILAKRVAEVGSKATLSTLISSYNGVLGANDEHARVNRVAGLNNTMLDRGAVEKIDANFQAEILGALDKAIETVLKSKAAPMAPVGIVGEASVPLVRRDAASTDRVIDRGAEFGLVGEGDVLRIFGHWNNNMDAGSYMDIGAVVLDEDFKEVSVSTWNSWQGARSWSTYSGDKFVKPGDSAAEFIDVKIAELKRSIRGARWVAMTVQSWAGWPTASVDFIAGAMLRQKAGIQKGEVFDARTVTTAFKPTTKSTQSVPFAVNLETGKILWLDSSNGSTGAGNSASNDGTVGSIVYDEVARPKLSMGRLAELWASAHGVATIQEPVDRDALLELL